MKVIKNDKYNFVNASILSEYVTEPISLSPAEKIQLITECGIDTTLYKRIGRQGERISLRTDIEEMK